MIQIDRGMPRRCLECFAYSSICGSCRLTGTAIKRAFGGYNSRLKNCPLKDTSNEQESGKVDVLIDLSFCPCREPDNSCCLNHISCSADNLASLIYCPLRLHAKTTFIDMSEEQEENE